MSSRARRLVGDVATDPMLWPQPDRVAQPPKPASRAAAPARSGDKPASTTDLDRASSVERDAFTKGYAQGERAGEAAAAARVDTMLRQLVGTIEEIASLRMGMMRRTEREIVQLAIAMAERIVRHEVDVDRELLIAMARVGIDRLGDNVTATIHLNPADYDAALAVRKGTPLSGPVQMVADALIVRGGCLVRSAFGVIDAGIDTQIRELTRVLIGEEAVEADQNGVTTPA